MKLRNKIKLYTAVLFAILFIIMNITVYITFSKMILNNELKAATKEMEKTTTDIGKGLGKIPEATLLRSYVPINGMIQMVSDDNRKLFSVTSSTEQKLITRNTKYLQGEQSKFITYQNKSYTIVSMPLILLDGSVASLQVTNSIQPTVDILTILKLVLIVVTVIAIIPVILSSRFLSKLITSPVTSMIRTMTDIRESGHFKRLPLEAKSKDELFQMGETFNHMIELLETNYKKQKLFVSNASHEFKTPLTIIESYASLLKRRGLAEPELFTESVEAIHAEAIRMKEMTEQLLLLAKHHEQWNIHHTVIDLRNFLSQAAQSFQNAFGREIHLRSKYGNRLEVKTDEKKLKQLLFIFLDNARKYSDEAITLGYGMENGLVFIKIIDRGIGIHHNELPKVFDRFYRVDQARSRKIGGSGLGLSLAKEIAAVLNIKIVLDSTESVGTTAILYLKK
ncbi:sensor histidine kinase [Neobacillus sp. LXY-1]|uniref:sensor histidine kinase n=1 Tax=Neobacillus sp. LXY-1 TaxID=3379133 RepID=UPI003EE1CCCE